MPNSAYLCCGIAERIYPSLQEGDYDPKEQTVACSAYCIPLLWFTCFRPEDWREATVKDDDGNDIRVAAPVVERRHLQQRLKESLPRLESLFISSVSLKSHAKALRESIATINRAFRFLTVEWEEIAGMADHLRFDQQARQIFQFMTGEDVAGVRDMILEMSAFDADRPFLSISAIAKTKNLPIEDWNNLHSLLGSELYRDALWIPKQECESEVVSEIVQVARDGNFERAWHLIQEGADVNVEDSDGSLIEKLIDWMARSSKASRTDGLKWLQHFLSVNAKVNDHALAMSASLLPLSEFTMLLSLNGNPNSRSVFDEPAIMMASTSHADALAKVKLLIDAGADPNLRRSFESKSGSVRTTGILDECVQRDLLALAEYVLQHAIHPNWVERAYWEVRANKKGQIKDGWLKILESYMPQPEPLVS